MTRALSVAPVLLLLGLQPVQAAYFNLHEGEEKCFVETVPQHQVLTVKYRHADNPGVECMVIFKDPQKKQVFSKRVGHEDSEQGRTAYMTQQRGEHRICVQCTGSRWFQTTALKWELSVDMGDTDFSKNPATRGNMKGIERSILSTMARAEAISAENEYG
ncbi:eca [Symbiodinium pilosum]|uniref:Eca protein n=1 Tax=Symbiodinium pilosum TaxID=2952 RepID=A0A812W714_SYMPI|nr:eca [Symbiodinium pilosum]